MTDAGKLLLEEARIILRQVETAETGVLRRARGETGQLVVGSAGATYFHPLIPTIIREYGMRYPDIVLAPHASNTSLLVARLHTGQVDITLIRPSVPRSTARILPDEVCYRPINGDAPHAEICLAYCRHDPSRAVQNFVAVARRAIRDAAQRLNNDDSKKAEKASAPPR